MFSLFIAAALAQAATPPPATDRDVVCWVGTLDAYLRARSRTDGPPAARDSAEERLREAMGYYLGAVRARHTTDATLGPAMRLARTSFQSGDPGRIVMDCMSGYHQTLEGVSPLVRAMMSGE